MTRNDLPERRAAIIAGYEEFAVSARSAAAGEKLHNVRQKYLTSAASWEHLAAEGRIVEQLRARRLAREPGL